MTKRDAILGQPASRLHFGRSLRQRRHRSRWKIRFVSCAKDETKDRFPHDLGSGDDAPDAVGLLRQTLAAQEDGRVVIARVEFSTNLANLLKSRMDMHIPLSGVELVTQKTRLLSIMAGAFKLITNSEGQHYDQKEHNVVNYFPASKTLFADWLAPIIRSGLDK